MSATEKRRGKKNQTEKQLEEEPKANGRASIATVQWIMIGGDDQSKVSKAKKEN